MTSVRIGVYGDGQNPINARKGITTVSTCGLFIQVLLDSQNPINARKGITTDSYSRPPTRCGCTVRILLMPVRALRRLFWQGLERSLP